VSNESGSMCIDYGEHPVPPVMSSEIETSMRFLHFGRNDKPPPSVSTELYAFNN
jgi:hypothetical protein